MEYGECGTIRNFGEVRKNVPPLGYSDDQAASDALDGRVVCSAVYSRVLTIVGTAAE